MKVELGINPIVWSNDDLRELGGDTPLETCLREARQAGYAGVELGHKFPREAEALRPKLGEAGLRLVSGWYSTYLLERNVDEELRAIEPHVRLLLALGAEVIILAECTRTVHPRPDAPLASRPVMTDGEWQRWTLALSELSRALVRRGLKVAYHHHLGTVVQTEAEVDRMMEHTAPELGLLLDTGHLRAAGGDPLRAATRWAERITHVHAKDVRADVLARFDFARRSFLDGVRTGLFTVPGDGLIDYRPVLGALAARGYRGWLVVEADQDPRHAHPLTYATKGRAALATAANDAGLTVVG